MKLTKNQREKLWGETGPYSEVHLTRETRILDDTVSRVFISVNIHVNPLTYELIKENREQFRDDPKIQQLIDSSEYWGLKEGYVSCAFLKEFTGDEVLKEAEIAVEYSKQTVIQIHKFMLELLELEPIGES